MPSVNIRELDLTGAETVEYKEGITLIPAIKVEAKDASGNTVSLDGLYTTVAELEQAVAEIFSYLPELPQADAEEPDWVVTLRNLAENQYVIKDKGYAMAYILLQQGLPVQYAGLYNRTVTPSSSDITAFYKEYEDRGKYDILFVTGGAFKIEGTDVTDTATLVNIIKAGYACAGNRGDAKFLYSAPVQYSHTTGEGPQAEVVTDKLDTSTKIYNWINKNFSEIADTKILRPAVTWESSATTETYGTYGYHLCPDIALTISVNDPVRFLATAFISTHIKAGYTTGAYTFKNAVFPGYLLSLLCFAKFSDLFAPWYAMTGSVRGVSPLASYTPLLKFGDADIEVLQRRTAEGTDKPISSNAICNIRPFGNLVWGNRTTHPLQPPLNGSSSKAQLTASSFDNIRVLCCILKKVLYRASRQYTFDPNSDTLWFNFKSAITPTLEKMKNNQGIRDFKFVKVATKKRAVLCARIIISPIEAVEDFDLTVELADDVAVVETA